ncbi:hypothetical protein E2C01_066411 [Portunus trituberculatus]|uniref:Uncharacterized protein n=1 Tax=Portunus trituberculatus TaxID=210409 RepID=A0A5B7HS93_PORTR|nr:hypothetical protein [Portunus trituberculatus]
MLRESRLNSGVVRTLGVVTDSVPHRVTQSVDGRQ